MSEEEMLGRLAAVEQLAVLSFAIVVLNSRDPNAQQKAAIGLKTGV